jgi:hypothetical protein
MSEITIEGWPDKRRGGIDRAPGRRKILVDGVQWGSILPERHGRRGTIYTFHDSTGKTIFRDVGDRSCRVEVRTDGGHKTSVVQRLLDIQAELLSTAQTLVADSLLRSPEVIASEKAARDARVQVIMDDERQEFAARAAAAIKPSMNLGMAAEKLLAMIDATDLDQSHPIKVFAERLRCELLAFDQMTADVVEAMRWAQTR